MGANSMEGFLVIACMSNLEVTPHLIGFYEQPEQAELKAAQHARDADVSAFVVAAKCIAKPKT